MSTEFDTARQVVAASLLGACEQPEGTDLDSDDPTDVHQALAIVSEGGIAEADRTLDSIYTLSLAAVADSRPVRVAARRHISRVCSAQNEYFVYMSDSENQRLADDATADALAVRAGVISAFRWLTPFAATHTLSSNALDILVPAVVDALSDTERMVQRGAALSTVAAFDSDAVRTSYSGTMADFRQSLVTATKDSDPYVRGHALSALECPKPTDDPDGFNTAIHVYLTALSNEPDCNRRTALDALRSVLVNHAHSHRDTPTEVLETAPRVVRGLEDCFSSSSPVIRRRASEILWKSSQIFSEQPNDKEILQKEIASIGETIAELPGDRETDLNLMSGLSSLIEQYPALADPAVSVANRVITNTPSESPPEIYLRTRPDYMRREAIELLLDVVAVAPAVTLPADRLYSALADPSESVREQTASLLVTIAEQSPDSLDSCRTAGLILKDHWDLETAEADNTSPTDPLTVIAKHSSKEAGELSRRLVAQTPDIEDSVELLRTMAEFAPETVNPVLKETTGRNGSY